MEPYNINNSNLIGNCYVPDNSVASTQIDYNPMISRLFSGFAQFAAKMDTISISLQNLDSRLRLVEQKQTILDVLVRTRIASIVQEPKDDGMGISEAVSNNQSIQQSNKRFLSISEIDQSNPKKQLVESSEKVFAKETSSIENPLVTGHPETTSHSPLELQKNTNAEYLIIEETEEVISQGTVETSESQKEITFQQLRIKPCVVDIDKYKAETILSSQVHVINQDTRVVDEQGELLILFIKKIEFEKFALSISSVTEKTKLNMFNCTTRGDAGGKFDAATINKKQEDFLVCKNPVRAVLKNPVSSGSEQKSKNKYEYSNRHPSVTLGYLGHNRTLDPCRESGKNSRANFTQIIPFLKEMGKIYAQYVPHHYKYQTAALSQHKIAQKENNLHFQIPDTPFTTLTINHSRDGKPTTYFHKDKNVLLGSLSCMFVWGKNYDGGETAFPEMLHPETHLPIAFDVKPGGFLIFNGTRLLHGNTPVKLGEDGDRVSIVAYALQTLTECTGCNIGKTSTKNKKSQSDKNSQEV